MGLKAIWVKLKSFYPDRSKNMGFLDFLTAIGLDFAIVLIAWISVAAVSIHWSEAPFIRKIELKASTIFLEGWLYQFLVFEVFAFSLSKIRKEHSWLSNVKVGAVGLALLTCNLSWSLFLLAISSAAPDVILSSKVALQCFSLTFSTLGGWVVARLSKTHILLNATVAGTVQILLSLDSRNLLQWYFILILLLILPTFLLGMGFYRIQEIFISRASNRA